MRLDVGDDEITVLIRRPTVSETRYQTRCTKASLRLYQYTRTEGTRWAVTFLEVPDPDFAPKVYQEIGTVRTESEVRDREAWESICHRPGNGTRLGQRDSLGRALYGYQGDTVRDIWRTSTTFQSDGWDDTLTEDQP